MMHQSVRHLFLFLPGILFFLPGCVDPFNPPEIDNTDSYLVFDGYVNANGTDTSWIRLSRTQNIHDTGTPQYENGASVTVEGERGLAFPFRPYPAIPGMYYLPPEYFSFAQKYRVSISLRERVYQSEWQQFTPSPPIDSVTYEIKGEDGIQIYVHTHDPSNQTKFYKWTFEETWEYNAALYSTLEVVDGRIIPRTVPINWCWDTRTATNINLFTTATLSQDIVRYHPVAYVPASTNKLLRTYSILVHQQTLTREGYDYWTELARNNETTGSIFDPFPSQLTGNIRSLNDPDEKVFGFFSGGVVQSERIFIRENLGFPPPCFIGVGDTLSYAEVLESGELIVYETDPPGGYIMASPHCVDCRLQGGTLDRPPFWP